ncbi:uncharacterized protein [Asterias amurensis]|uniref:uncharacterized protein n=1 Tax=Asterias amurensis TaxID=7602 RepID=UPI003AB71811
MDQSMDSDELESGSLTTSSPPLSTPSPQLDRLRPVADYSASLLHLDDTTPHDNNNVCIKTKRSSSLGLKSSSDYQLHIESKPRRASQQDFENNVMPSSGSQSLINFDTGNILKSSYNLTTSQSQGVPTGRHLEGLSHLNPEFNGNDGTTDPNNNETTSEWQYLATQRKPLSLHPIPRKSPYPPWRFSQSRQPPETALDIAFRTMLDYKQPMTLHRPSKADRRMVHYDYLPSIKVISSKDQRRRNDNRNELKQQLQLAEERKRREILEMESDFFQEDDRDDPLQKNIFLPSGEEYEFSEGGLPVATLPVPSQRKERSSSRQSSLNGSYDGRRQSNASHESRRPSFASHDGRRPSDASIDSRRPSNVSLNVNGASYAGNSTLGSKRRHSVNTMVRREKLFTVVSHWPGLQKPSTFFQTPLDEPPNESDSPFEEPRPPSAQSKRSLPNSKTMQKRAKSKGLP